MIRIKVSDLPPQVSSVIQLLEQRLQEHVFADSAWKGAQVTFENDNVTVDLR